MSNNNTSDLSEEDQKAIEEYSFQVPYDDSTSIHRYNEAKAKAFEAGIRYARAPEMAAEINSLKAEIKSLEAENERLREALDSY